MSEETDALIDAAEAYAEVYDGDDRQDIKTDVLNAFFAGSKYEATNNADIATIAYMNGVTEGKKHANALVTAAYHTAAEVCEQKSKAAWYAYKHFPINSEERANPHYQGIADGADECMQDIEALTPADAEKALREFGLRVAREASLLADQYGLGLSEDKVEQLVDEVLKA